MKMFLKIYKSFNILLYIALINFTLIPQNVRAQELYAKVTINHSQIQTTDNSIFESLKKQIEQFINNHSWTNLQFAKQERIVCNINITISKYNKENNNFVCKALIQANRPIYNASYTSILYSNVDNDFNFDYAPFDQLEFNQERVDNQLTALIAYYAYLIIGINLDSFAPLAGTDILQQCLALVNNAQNLNFKGWKSYDSSKNRFAIINDYLDGAMNPFRELQYSYYRKGLDEMTNNTNRARANITTALQNLLKKCHEDKPLSILPQIWSDYKKEEIANIYKGKGTPKEKEEIFDLFMSINAGQSTSWNKIKE